MFRLPLQFWAMQVHDDLKVDFLFRGKCYGCAYRSTPRFVISQEYHMKNSSSTVITTLVIAI
ncbi:hypothetical protein BH23GEM9_BH23GEM9_32890 [soil metagenome]